MNFKQIFLTKDRKLTDHSRTGSNGNERVLHTPQSSKTRALLSDAV